MSTCIFPAAQRVLRCLAFALLLGTSFVAAPSTSSSQEPEAQAAANQAGGEQAAAPAPKSKVWWFIESSGWIGALILVLSIYFIATVSRLFVEMRLSEEMPEALLADCNAHLEKREYQSIYDLVRQDRSMFARLITAGLTELAGGLPEARDAMERTSEVATVEMEKKISMLAVLGTLGPMIGLLGTLKGMIASFSVIALSDTQLRASEVAGGISEALLLTFEGVALSVPAIYFFAVFRNRVSTISAVTLLAADEFMRRLGALSRNKAGAAAPPPARPAT